MRRFHTLIKYELITFVYEAMMQNIITLGCHIDGKDIFVISGLSAISLNFDSHI